MLQILQGDVSYKAILSIGSCRFVNWLKPFYRLAYATLFSVSGDYSQGWKYFFPVWECWAPKEEYDFEEDVRLSLNNAALLSDRGRLLKIKAPLFSLKGTVAFFDENRLTSPDHD